MSPSLERVTITFLHCSCFLVLFFRSPCNCAFLRGKRDPPPPPPPPPPPLFIKGSLRPHTPLPPKLTFFSGSARKKKRGGKKPFSPHPYSCVWPSLMPTHERRTRRTSRRTSRRRRRAARSSLNARRRRRRRPPLLLPTVKHSLFPEYLFFFLPFFYSFFPRAKETKRRKRNARSFVTSDPSSENRVPPKNKFWFFFIPYCRKFMGKSHV